MVFRIKDYTKYKQIVIRFSLNVFDCTCMLSYTLQTEVTIAYWNWDFVVGQDLFVDKISYFDPSSDDEHFLVIIFVN